MPPPKPVNETKMTVRLPEESARKLRQIVDARKAAGYRKYSMNEALIDGVETLFQALGLE